MVVKFVPCRRLGNLRCDAICVQNSYSITERHDLHALRYFLRPHMSLCTFMHTCCTAASGCALCEPFLEMTEADAARRRKTMHSAIECVLCLLCR